MPYLGTGLGLVTDPESVCSTDGRAPRAAEAPRPSLARAGAAEPPQTLSIPRNSPLRRFLGLAAGPCK